MLADIILIIFGLLLIIFGTLIYFKYNKRKNKNFTSKQMSLTYWFKKSIWLIFIVSGIILLALCIAVNM
ncbi:hypothetical protein CXP39_00130 [Mesoplasma syrphidae]|uniref:Uncharacterized protein n=1 Tax=Mesoplasma syrphidae TaxID=225999 RepID=A0A2K9BXX5_9MOLU|nr:hypothetical protein [Mesoplasma syrphidae]AUF83218.1 hypothetical protein CXP39_00130 [Mesoplasma syrphidae]